MITTRVPETWQDLQSATAQIFVECGLSAEIEKDIRTVRGSVEVDVVATEVIYGRERSLFCECKRWKTNVPQDVVHAFRTVVQDAGASTGYIVSASSFQSGAYEAAANSNVRLVTWSGFQEEFETQWVGAFLRPEVARTLDPLFSYAEPINSTVFRHFDRASKEQQANFNALRDKYFNFGNTMMLFTPYVVPRLGPALPTFPLEKPDGSEGSVFPPNFHSEVGLREWLAECIEFGQEAIQELREALAVGDEETF